MDVVYLYRTSYSEELRYSLRSLKNLPHDNVYIVGDRTRFKVRHVEVKQTGDIALNTFNSLTKAAQDPDISEDFILMHDDFFMIRPVSELGVYHRGYLSDVLRKDKLRRNYYVSRMHRTRNKLLSMGITRPLCYEVHVPFVINKQKWLAVAPRVKGSYNKLTMYGNLNNIGGKKIKDVKLMNGNIDTNSCFISTHDSTFNSGVLGKRIKEIFENKGMYEH